MPASGCRPRARQAQGHRRARRKGSRPREGVGERGGEASRSLAPAGVGHAGYGSRRYRRCDGLGPLGEHPSLTWGRRGRARAASGQRRFATVRDAPPPPARQRAARGDVSRSRGHGLRSGAPDQADFGGRSGRAEPTGGGGSLATAVRPAATGRRRGNGRSGPSSRPSPGGRSASACEAEDSANRAVTVAGGAAFMETMPCPRDGGIGTDSSGRAERKTSSSAIDAAVRPRPAARAATRARRKPGAPERRRIVEMRVTNPDLGGLRPSLQPPATSCAGAAPVEDSRSPPPALRESHRGARPSRGTVDRPYRRRERRPGLFRTIERSLPTRRKGRARCRSPVSS